MTIESYPSLPGLGFPVKRKPEWQSVRFEALSGRRTIAPKQAFPRWRWELPYAVLRSAAFVTSPVYDELEELVAFFNARSADGMVFSYTDQEDNTATAQGFGTGDGASTEFQLYRAYGGFSEPIYSAVVTDLKVAGVTLPGTDYAVGETGLVTFDVAPANGAALTWTGTFAFLCRFDDDTLDLQRFLTGVSSASTPVRFSSELAL